MAINEGLSVIDKIDNGFAVGEVLSRKEDLISKDTMAETFFKGVFKYFYKNVEKRNDVISVQKRRVFLIFADSDDCDVF